MLFSFFTKSMQIKWNLSKITLERRVSCFEEPDFIDITDMNRFFFSFFFRKLKQPFSFDIHGVLIWTRKTTSGKVKQNEIVKTVDYINRAREGAKAIEKECHFCLFKLQLNFYF